jgi:prepilin-type N-terminal cleavage/methylation domain-containing protein
MVMVPRPFPAAAFCRRRGFTLVELSLTLAILAVAMSVTVQVLGGIAAQRRAIERRQYAAQEAANVLERFAARPFDGLTPEAARSVSLSDDARQALPGAELTVIVDDKAASPDSKRVAVRLRWRQRSGEWETPVRLTTWIERRGHGRGRNTAS